MRIEIRTFMVAAALIGAGAVLMPTGIAWAQFVQYTRPGSLSTEISEVSQLELEAAMEEARWHLGPVRLDPWIGVRDAAWIDDPTSEAESTDSDFTVTAGAGVRAYLPTGPKIVWAAHALPEYVWWQRLKERERLNGRYGVGMFGFFNRLETEVLASRNEFQGVVSAEELERVNSRRDELAVGARLLVSPKLVLFVEGSQARLEHLLEEEERPFAAPLDSLDRDETVARLGARFVPRDGVSFGVGVEQTDVEFLGAGLDRSNEGLAPFVDVAVERGKVGVDARVAWRDLEAQEGATFVPYDGITGTVALTLDGNRVDIIPYLRRNLSFSLNRDYSYFETQAGGLSVAFELGTRSILRLYGETGTNDYVAAGESVPERRRDQTSYGVGLTIDLPRELTLTLGADQTRFESNLPGDDQEITGIRVGLVFGASTLPWV